MAAATDEALNSTQALASVVFLLLLLVPVAAAAAAVIKRRYARAVVALQAATARAGLAGQAASADTPAAEVAPEDLSAARAGLRQPAEPLTFDLNGESDGAARSSDAGAEATPRLALALRLRRRVLTAQLITGALLWAWLLLCLALAVGSYDQLAPSEAPAPQTSGWGWTALLPLLGLPPAIAWALQAGVRERRLWSFFAAGTLVLGASLLTTGIGWRASGGFMLGCAFVGLLVATFTRPAVRGAGPPLMAALSLCVLLVSLALFGLAALETRAAASAGPGHGDLWLAIGLGVGGLLLGALGAWRLLVRLARRYAERRYSEQQLALGTYWGLIVGFVAGFVLLLSFEERTGTVMRWFALLILAGWLIWRWRLARRLRRVLADAPPTLPALLLLRVFKPSGASEAFNDRLLSRWRFAGPVWMIAGPDLAGAQMEPDEFLAYARGTLADRFIAEARQVPQALAGLRDGQRDPDGRCRVHELFCSNLSWQPVARALMQQAGAVLLDLRGFTPQRLGTRFELAELLRSVPLARVRLLVGPDQDLTLLQSQIQAIWAEVGGQRDEALGAARLRLIALPDDGAETLMRLMRELEGAMVESPGPAGTAGRGA